MVVSESCVYMVKVNFTLNHCWCETTILPSSSCFDACGVQKFQLLLPITTTATYCYHCYIPIATTTTTAICNIDTTTTATQCSHKDYTYEFSMIFSIYKYHEFIFREFYMKKQPFFILMFCSLVIFIKNFDPINIRRP